MSKRDKQEAASDFKLRKGDLADLESESESDGEMDLVDEAAEAEAAQVCFDVCCCLRLLCCVV